MRRLAPRLLILLTLAVVPYLAVANWGGSDTVSVRFYGDDWWADPVATSVAYLNEATSGMPHAPAWVFVRKAQRSCKKVTSRRRAGITICTMTNEAMPRMRGEPISGMAKANITDRQRGGAYLTPDLDVWWGHIVINADKWEPNTGLICHELVHVVTGERDGPRDQDSCMRGNRMEFGSWDIAAMARKYGIG